MALNKKEIAEKVAEGYIHALITFEVVGKPKKHVDDTLTEYMDQIKAEKLIDIVQFKQEKASELEDEEGFFSAFSEVEMVVPDMDILTYISFNLSPASIEILAPDEFHFEGREIQNWLNDVVSQIHSIGHALRTAEQARVGVSHNITRLLRNMVSILLTTGPRTEDELQKLTGVEATPLNQMLALMEKDGVIQKEGKSWTLSSSEK